MFAPREHAEGAIEGCESDAMMNGEAEQVSVCDLLMAPQTAREWSDGLGKRDRGGDKAVARGAEIYREPFACDHSVWHWFGTFSVAPNGRIDSVWLDTRNTANNGDSQLFYSYSTDGGDTWAPNVAVSDSFSPFVGYPNQRKLGDYITIVSDDTGGNVAYAATFNGEEDIYYVHVTPMAADLAQR